MSLNLATIVRENALRHPGRIALLAGDLSLDHRDLDARARHFAGTLARLGVRRGGNVALLLPNAPAFPIAYFGAHYLGAPVVPLNTQLTADEIAYHLNDSDAVALVAAEECLDAARAAMTRAESCTRLIPARDVTEPPSPADGPSVDDLSDTHADDTAVILYTSGTTGRPKGAELTHFNLFCNAEQIARIFSFDETTRSLAALPLFHCFGQTNVMNSTLQAGGAVVLMPRFEAGAALDLMARHRVSFLAGVPTMYFAMLHHPAGASADLSSLKWCQSGGAPMPVEVMRAFEDRHGVTILESYGLSETSPLASANRPGLPRKPGSIGAPIPRVEFRLVDDAGRVVQDVGAPGEICIKGYNVAKGYYKRPEATAEAIQDGWLRTGDIGVRDEDGYYFIVDRKKDMILRGGYNVYPREIEEVLYAHPAVAEAAVVGVKDERLGEEVKAFIACRPGMKATAEEILEYCRGRLASYKHPRLIEFRTSLPKGPTGKILKRELRD